MRSKVVSYRGVPDCFDSVAREIREEGGIGGMIVPTYLVPNFAVEQHSLASTKASP